MASLARRVAAAGFFVVTAAAAHDAGEMLDWTHAPRDTLPWGILAKVGVQYVDGHVAPQFLPPVVQLDGKRVTLYGFMMPVGEGTRTRQFLLTDRPLWCGSCDPVGPEGVVEINTRSSMAAARQVVAVRGILHVLRSDPKSVLYRMTDAQVVTQQVSQR